MTTQSCIQYRLDFQNLLERNLTPQRESEIVGHLDFCQDCQQQLESINALDTDWAQAARMLQAGGQIIIQRSVEPRSSSETMSDIVSRRGTQPQHDELYRSLLSPTDDPNSMGRIGNLEILAVIGHGGAGIVYKAHDSALGRNVAVKILDPRAGNQHAARTRFAREARAMAAISHEHVVPVYAVAEHQGLPYFVMEYVTGGTLARRIALNGRLGIVETIRIGIQIARGLDAAHRQGVVHRDVKPSNILLDPGVERVRVADFGLARAATDHTQTESGALVGTPHYMSPEQVRSRSIDGRSDLFSLGSVLYYAVTGHVPFDADSVYSLLQKITSEQPWPPSHWNAEVPVWFDGLITRLLSKSPDDRFASADELTEVLEQELALLQQPETKPEPHRPWLPKPTPTIDRFHSGSRLIGIALAACLTAAVGFWGLMSGPQDSPNIPDSSNGHGKQLPLTNELQLWGDRFLAQTQHNTVAFNIGPEMMDALSPDQSREVAQAVWPAIQVPDVKTGMLKAFYFNHHPQVLQILHLGMLDTDERVQDYARTYVQQIALRKFDVVPDAYSAWYERWQDATLDMVFADAYQKLAHDLRSAKVDVALQLIKEFNVDFGSSRFRTGYPSEHRAVQATNLGETVIGWISDRQAIHRSHLQPIAQVIADFPFSHEQFDSQLIPILEDQQTPGMLRAAIAFSLRQVNRDRSRQLLLDLLVAALPGPSDRMSHQQLELFRDVARKLAEQADPQSIAPLIDLLSTQDDLRVQSYIRDALTNPFMGDITGVKNAAFTDAAWWQQWWQENHQRLPAPANTMQLTAGKSDRSVNAAPDPKTSAGRQTIFLDEFEKFRRGQRHQLRSAATLLAEAGDVAAIPHMIAAIEADNSHETIYDVGYFGLGFQTLGKLTGVKYSPLHDGAWWRRWWDANQDRFANIQVDEFPVLPATEHGQSYRPLPEDLSNHELRMNWLREQIEHGNLDLRLIVAVFNQEDADPRGVPVLIGLMAAWPNPQGEYLIGNLGLGLGPLGELTKVQHEPSQDAVWWQAWWLANRHHFPQASEINIPVFDLTEEHLKPAGIAGAVPTEHRQVGDDTHQQYFLIGDTKITPSDGFNLLIVLPGGGGGKDFLPFVQSIHRDMLDRSWLIAQPLAFQWHDQQQIVWPKHSDTVPGMTFTTEQFVNSVIDDIGKAIRINRENIITLSWSSSGPAAYAIATTPDTKVTGSLITMSVFQPRFCRDLDSAKGRRFVIMHSREDSVCPWDQSQQAVEFLQQHGALVDFREYIGGHGWHPDLLGQLPDAIERLVGHQKAGG